MIVRETVITSPTAADQTATVILANLTAQAVELEKLLQDMRRRQAEPEPQG